MRGSETVSEYPFAHSSLQLHEISTYMPHETLHCKKILDYLSTIRWEKVSTIKKHNCQSATKWTYEGTTSNSRTTNKDWNAAMTARQNRVLLICEPASHASHDASHASHASHGFNVRKNMRAMRAKVPQWLAWLAGSHIRQTRQNTHITKNQGAITSLPEKD